MSEIKILPILPLRDIVVFPHQPVPLFVGREKSVRALEEAMRNEGKEILLATQKDKDDDDPAPAAIYDVGVVATVLQLLKLPDGTVKVLVEGRARAGVTRFTEQAEAGPKVAAALALLKDIARQYPLRVLTIVVAAWALGFAISPATVLAQKYLHKGSLVYIEGRLKTRYWEDREHNKKVITEIIADNLIMLDKKLDIHSNESHDAHGGHLSLPDDLEDHKEV